MPRSTTRPWRMTLIPLCVSSNRWGATNRWQQSDAVLIAGQRYSTSCQDLEKKGYKKIRLNWYDFQPSILRCFCCWFHGENIANILIWQKKWCKGTLLKILTTKNINTFVDKSGCSMSRIVKELRWEVEVALCFLLPGQSWTLIEGTFEQRHELPPSNAPNLAMLNMFRFSFAGVKTSMQVISCKICEWHFCTALAFSKSDFSVLESHFESTRTTWKTTATSIDRALVFVQPNSGESHLSFFKSCVTSTFLILGINSSHH